MKTIVSLVLSVVIFFALAGLPVHAADLSKQNLEFGALHEIFPHIAVGGPWSTTIILQNLDANVAVSKIEFFRPDGSPWVVNWRTANNAGTHAVIALTFNPLGQMTIELPQTGGAIETGWARLSQDFENGPIAGQAIFRDNGGPGRPIPFEAVVPLSDWSESDTLGEFEVMFLPFDQTKGFNTCLAVANDNNSTSTVNIVAVDEQSGVVQDVGVTRSLPALGQTSFCLRDTLPQLQGRRGYLVIARPSFSGQMIGFRFDPSGSFTTLFPVGSRYN